jgi:hypothetical protein
MELNTIVRSDGTIVSIPLQEIRKPLEFSQPQGFFPQALPMAQDDSLPPAVLITPESLYNGACNRFGEITALLIIMKGVQDKNSFVDIIKNFQLTSLCELSKDHLKKNFDLKCRQINLDLSHGIRELKAQIERERGCSPFGIGKNLIKSKIQLSELKGNINIIDSLLQKTNIDSMPFKDIYALLNDKAVEKVSSWNTSNKDKLAFCKQLFQIELDKLAPCIDDLSKQFDNYLNSYAEDVLAGAKEERIKELENQILQARNKTREFICNLEKDHENNLVIFDWIGRLINETDKCLDLFCAYSQADKSYSLRSLKEGFSTILDFKRFLPNDCFSEIEVELECLLAKFPNEDAEVSEGWGSWTLNLVSQAIAPIVAPMALPINVAASVGSRILGYTEEETKKE